MFKKVFVAVAIVAVAGLGSCKKIEELLTFNIAFTSKATISPMTGINLPIDVFTPDITTNAETEFSTRNTNKDLIDKILLKELRLTVTSPTGQTLDFLSSVEIFIQAEGLGELRIAEQTNIADNVGAVLNLNVGANDLAPYIKKDKFKLRMKAVTDKTVNRQVSIDIFSDFAVTAKVL